MADFLQQIRDKNSINGKLFKYKDKFGLILQYISAKDVTEYDEVEYYYNGQIYLVPAIWMHQYIDEIIF
jgi:hypothetical protein